MSLKRHTDAVLVGFDGPIFPPAVAELRAAQNKSKTQNGTQLEAAARDVPGFKKTSRPTTSDDYDWFWSLHFERDGLEVAVLFPWAQDWGKSDGDQSDRSIAVYTKGNVVEDQANIVLLQLAAAMLQPAAV